MELFEIGKCQIQSDNLLYWPEQMPCMIKYQTSDSLAVNLKIIVELFLKMAADGFFLEFLKPLSQNSLN